MRAIIISQPGPPSVLRFEEVPDPEPGPGELLARVEATSLNRADLLQRMGLYPPPPGTSPDIPGLEFAGTVSRVPPGETRFRSGDAVMGLLPGEGYAEQVRIPCDLAVQIPEGMDYIEAAAIPEVFLTAYDALFLQLDLSAGNSLLIHAVGSGVGTAALQLAKAIGVTVIGTAGSATKLKQALHLGLDAGINYRQASLLKTVLEQTHGQGVDAILDLVGARHWKANLESLKVGGCILLVGLVSGRKVDADLSTILRKRLRVMGTVLRSRSLDEKRSLVASFRQTVLPLFKSKQISPVIHKVFPWNEVVAAHTYMEENRNFGKIVLKVS